MAITTLDGVIAGMRPGVYFSKSTTSNSALAGRPYSFANSGGNPGVMTLDTTPAGVALSSASSQVDGQIYFDNPGGSDGAYLARLQAQSNLMGTLLLCDRLWHNGGLSITSTSAQTINSATFPARDDNGSVNGKGVLIGVETVGTTGTGTPTLTVGYTNSAGASGRSAANVDATQNTAGGNWLYRIGLQSGDFGVKSVETFTLSASWTSGELHLVAYRVLAALEISQANVPNAIDALTVGFPKLYPGTVPFLVFIPSSSNFVSDRK